jgi:hypothetical protein
MLARIGLRTSTMIVAVAVIASLSAPGPVIIRPCLDQALQAIVHLRMGETAMPNTTWLQPYPPLCIPSIR